MAVEMEAQPSKGLWGGYGSVEARELEGQAFLVWASHEVHDFKLFWLYAEAIVHEELFQDGVCVL